MALDGIREMTSQFAESNSPHTVTYFEVAPSQANSVAQKLLDLRKHADLLAGLRGLKVLRRTTRSHHFVIIAGWDKIEAFEEARAGVLQSSFDQLDPNLIAGIDTRIHSGVIGGPDGTRSSTAMFVVTHVDVPPPNKDRCIELLTEQVANARQRTGNASYEVFQQADRPNHFTIVEGWSTADDYQAHLVSDHTRRFRKKLTPLSGALYDERIYSEVEEIA